jgi:hypothetical protein
MVRFDKFSISERSLSIEYEVIGSLIENIMRYVQVLILDLVFDDEAHVAEGHANVLIEDEPIVV